MSVVEKTALLLFIFFSANLGASIVLSNLGHADGFLQFEVCLAAVIVSSVVFMAAGNHKRGG